MSTPQNNTPRNTISYVCDYQWPIEVELKGKSLIVNVNHVGDIRRLNDALGTETPVQAYIYRDAYGSLETLDVDPDWGDIPIVLYLNRLGQFRTVAHKVEMLKGLNVTVIFTGEESRACVDAQILASLGIHSGIKLTPDSPLSDSVLDLITYNFYSQMPHADIEPFSTMSRHYKGENYVSPSLLDLENPARYLHVDAKHRLAFTRDDLLAGNVLDFTSDDATDTLIDDAAQLFSRRWQQWFVESRPCTFCPAFRVCKGFFHASEKSTERCTEVMSELLEAIEFERKKCENHSKKPCQL